MNAKQVVLYTVLAISVLIGIYVLYLIRDVLILLFIAILFATAMDPLVDWMRRWIGRGKAILVIYFLIASALGGIGYLLAQALVAEISTLITNLPDVIRSLQSFAASIDVAIIREPLQGILNEIAAALGMGPPGQPGQPPPVTGEVAQGVFSVTVSVVSVVFGFFTMLVIAYYWIIDRQDIIRLFVSLLPPDKRATGRTIWQLIEDRLGGWVRGELALMGIIFALSAVGYTLLGVKYALLLAVIAGLAEIIPILGPYIGSAPAILIALTQNVWLGVAVIVWAIIIQSVEGNVLAPRILGSTVGVSPLVVLLALLIGASLKGIVGALLAVPIAGALQVIVESLVLEREPAPASLTPSQPPPRSVEGPPPRVEGPAPRVEGAPPVEGPAPWQKWLRQLRGDRGPSS